MLVQYSAKTWATPAKRQAIPFCKCPSDISVWLARRSCAAIAPVWRSISNLLQPDQFWCTFFVRSFLLFSLRGALEAPCHTQPLKVAFPQGNRGALRSQEGEGFRKEGDGGEGKKKTDAQKLVSRVPISGASRLIASLPLSILLSEPGSEKSLPRKPDSP